MVFSQNVVYNVVMRILFIFLILFSATANAEPKTFFEHLMSLGKTECEAFLDNGDALVNASNKAANKKDWDEAFYYDEQAFHTYLKAFGHCDAEPENKEKAISRLDINQAHGDELTCVYYISESMDAYQRSTLALEHLESASISLKHANQSLSAIENAENFCAADVNRIDQITQLKELVIKTVGALQAHIDEFGEDGFGLE